MKTKPLECKKFLVPPHATGNVEAVDAHLLWTWSLTLSSIQ